MEEEKEAGAAFVVVLLLALSGFTRFTKACTQYPKLRSSRGTQTLITVGGSPPAWQATSDR